MSNLYERIDELCKSEGINMTEMCRRTGVPRGNLTDLCKGRQKSLATKNMIKIANYFNVSVEYLETGEKEKAPTLSGEDSIFADKFSQLDEADKAYISGQIDALLSKRG